MKKSVVIALLFVMIVCISGVKFSSVAPEGYTGATGVYCTNCHADYPINAAGGNVELLGLPVGNYVPNATYNLLLKINHLTNDRTRWGFAIKATNATGSNIGTFTTTNANAYINGDELSHFYAVTTNPQSSFTYDSLKWTAPATAGNAMFYYVGNAANNSAGNDGDYIYSGVSVIALSITLKDFKAKVVDKSVSLFWEIMSNSHFDFFDIERSDDGQFFFKTGAVKANNSSSFSYSYTDNSVTNNNQNNTFYRLKSIDKNGEIHYSKTVSVQIKNTDLVIKNIYPTIAKPNENITVEINSHQNTKLKILLVDAVGNIIQNKNCELTKGNNRIELQLDKNCLSGIKFLKFIAPNFVTTKTIIVAQ